MAISSFYPSGLQATTANVVTAAFSVARTFVCVVIDVAKFSRPTLFPMFTPAIISSATAETPPGKHHGTSTR